MMNRIFQYSAWIGILGLVAVIMLVRSTAPLLPTQGQIAFSAMANDHQSLLLVDVARDIQHTLRSGAQDYHALSWSHDGTRFAFAETEALTKSDRLWLTDFSDYHTNAIYPDRATGTIATPPVWSDRGDHLAYRYGDTRTNETSLLQSSITDRLQTTLLMPFSDTATITRYTDTFIEWVDVTPDQVRLEHLDLENSQQQTIHTWDFAFMRHWEPVPAPDGSKIIISGFTQNVLDYELYLFDLNSDEVHNLTNSRNYNDSNPAWSADGRMISYKSLNGDNNIINVMSADGSNAHIVYRDKEARLSQIQWSPDGTSLAFVANRPLEYRLCVLHLDDGALACPVVTRKISDIAWRPE